VFDARLAHKKTQEEINETALALAESGALGLLNTRQTSVKNRNFLTRLAQGLIKSGCAMCILGSSRPASGSEHKISHALDHLFAPRKTLHGEQVGIATLFTMALQENKQLTRVMHLYGTIRFPHTLRHLSVTENQFIKVVQRAHTFRPYRYTILEDREITPEVISQTMHTAGLI
jgi:glycerol-1-phosphate dehydrogenase [NAD(P)+]